MLRHSYIYDNQYGDGADDDDDDDDDDDGADDDDDGDEDEDVNATYKDIIGLHRNKNNIGIRIYVILIYIDFYNNI